MRPTVVSLDNAVQNYAWGSTTAIAELLGRPSPGDLPEAELWIGAHPKAPSRVIDGSGECRLDEWIRKDPAATLGPAVAERYGELPFLLKVLAAAEPLSIQCHPNPEQARAGFARENEAGLSFSDPRPHTTFLKPI
jgi:mannose-6-phosphate isomerase